MDSLLDNVSNLGSKEIQSKELLDELFAMESNFEHEQKRQQLERRAKELKIVTEFKRLYSSYKRDFKAVMKTADGEVIEAEASNQTDFRALDEQGQLFCGMWKADEYGVRIRTDSGEYHACSHPIFPTKILRNAEDGTFKIELKFSLRGKLRTAITDRATIASATKILSLANQGVIVTSVTAQYLVKYLADVEALNPDLICEQVSTSKLGWMRESDGKMAFIPYDSEVIFDNENNMKSLFDSVSAKGNYEEWLAMVKDCRARKQNEFNVSLVASYASALVEPCGTLPFIVDLYGGTGIGKSVILNVVSSVWGNPFEYITDAKSTFTAMEIRLNVLNSLPMCLDDLAQLSVSSDEDFSDLIYHWCSGQSKNRSNQSLGLNKVGRWRNCTITNGERSLVTESMKGGAVNRVIDIEASGQVIFDGERGNRTVNLVKNCYGHSGKDWIFVLQAIGEKELKKQYEEWFTQLRQRIEMRGLQKSDKQIQPMALILLADQLTERLLFRDGVRLDMDECIDYLKDTDEVDENKRCYEFLLGEISVNDFHFRRYKDEEDFPQNVACWGFYQDDTNSIAINPNVFKKMLESQNFQPKSFKSWLNKQGLIDKDSDGKNLSKKFRFGNRTERYIVIRLEDDEETLENTGFVDDLGDSPFT